MLDELRIENLLLIERAELRLAPGLNVLTGETGAGKTVLAHALDLLLGARPRAGIVRPGAEEAYVEGTFLVPQPLREHLPGASGESPSGEEVVLARRVGADGRTRAYINGRSAAVGDLRALGRLLLGFYGQHEHRKLTLAAAQLAILDGVCGEEQRERLRACAATHRRAGELAAAVERLDELGAARARELDLLDHELAEIDELGSDLDERERLLVLRERLRRLDALLAAAGTAAELLGSDVGERASAAGGEGRPGAAGLAAEAAGGLDSLAGVDPSLDELARRAHALALDAQELASDLRGFSEGLVADAVEPDRDGAGADGEAGVEALEERLAAVDRVIRKHGGSVEAVRSHEQGARARREELARAELDKADAAEQLAQARAELEEHCLALRRARCAAAVPFATAVREQLAPLAMPGARFEVSLTEIEAGPSGADAAEFLIAPNRGVPAAPLREIASGGELSRVMLAIMSAGEATAEQSTLVFDEVDAGIGGQTARAVGARLRDLAARRQVICITHLPQIASLADRHFSIVKDAEAATAQARVCQLEDGEVVGELVRMLGADSHDKVALRHARELLRAA